MTKNFQGFQLQAPAWTNWVGNQSCVTARIVEASNEQDVETAIVEASRSGLRLRTPGTGHSFTPVSCTDGILLDTRGLRGITAIDKTSRTARVKAHTTIAELGAPLWEAGLALKNQGDIDTQTIAGVVATSTHGSGQTLGSFSSVLSACRLVDADGKIRELSLDKTPGEMAAAQCSIGMLGIMTELTIQLAPAYHLHERIVFMPLDELRERWDQLLTECSDLAMSEVWYENIFGKPPIRRPMPGLVDWRFSDSAELQLFEAPEHAGRSTLTLGVGSLADEVKRLNSQGIVVGRIEDAENFSIIRLRDPDNNLIVFACAKKRNHLLPDPDYGDGTEA